MPDRYRRGGVAARLAATRRVLSVEDDTDIADFLRAYFRASGYDVVHVDPNVAADVVAAVDEHRPDCVLLDIGLRGFSGLDAYRLLRTDRRFAFLPVIVVTADATARLRTGPIAAGIDGFAEKPFNVQTLAALVSERIAAAHALSEHGGDDVFGLMSQDYLSARLRDEIAVAAHGRTPLLFVLARLRSLPETVAVVGDEGAAYVVRELVRQGRDILPATAALGRTRSDELAVILPGLTLSDGRQLVERALAVLTKSVRLPGGAVIPVDLVAGLAAYPDHARTPDELYMAADAALADAVDGGRALALAV